MTMARQSGTARPETAGGRPAQVQTVVFLTGQLLLSMIPFAGALFLPGGLPWLPLPEALIVPTLGAFLAAKMVQAGFEQTGVSPLRKRYVPRALVLAALSGLMLCAYCLGLEAAGVRTGPVALAELPGLTALIGLACALDAAARLAIELALRWRSIVAVPMSPAADAQPGHTRHGQETNLRPAGGGPGPTQGAWMREMLDRPLVWAGSIEAVHAAVTAADDAAGSVPARVTAEDAVVRRVKRALDIAIALAALIFFLPLMSIIAILIRLDSAGPVLFTQERWGGQGRTFRIYKFRTIHPDAPARLAARLLQQDPELRREYELYHKLLEDPRITRVGRFLRRTSLDKLPQLFNVLSGDMSIVGPRPYMVSELPKLGALKSVIGRAKPGVTGLWQVAGRHTTTFAERAAIESVYVMNQSLWLDLRILLRTAFEVLRSGGRYDPDEGGAWDPCEDRLAGDGATPMGPSAGAGGYSARPLRSAA